MGLYHEKTQAVRDAYDKVEIALSLVEGVKYEYMKKQRIGLISIFNVSAMEWDKEAILNIYWDASHEEPFFTLVSYPNSNVPFKSRQQRIDVDEDGDIDIQDIVAIATDFFAQLND